MNIHPLFVHFPIGLLVTYSILELIALISPAARRQSWLFSVKAFLLFVGVGFAFVALVTGGMAEELVAGANPRSFIIEVHEPFAVGATFTYLVLALAYLVRIFDQMGWGARIAGTNAFFVRMWNIKKILAHAVLDTWLAPLLALFALCLIIVTGSLGAALVYGPNIDPFVSFIYHLFWKS